MSNSANIRAPAPLHAHVPTAWCSGVQPNALLSWTASVPDAWSLEYADSSRACSVLQDVSTSTRLLRDSVAPASMTAGLFWQWVISEFTVAVRLEDSKLRAMAVRCDSIPDVASNCHA